MDYKDEVSRNTAIKKEHLTEIASAITALATHASIAVDVSKMTYEKVNSVNVKLLQSAIHTLEKGFSENCCEVNCCQTCQVGNTCQSCQACQGCQACQKCQTCQSCQKCQQYQWRYKSNCNCNCGDDGG